MLLSTSAGTIKLNLVETLGSDMLGISGAPRGIWNLWNSCTTMETLSAKISHVVVDSVDVMESILLISGV